MAASAASRGPLVMQRTCNAIANLAVFGYQSPQVPQTHAQLRRLQKQRPMVHPQQLLNLPPSMHSVPHVTILHESLGYLNLH